MIRSILNKLVRGVATIRENRDPTCQKMKKSTKMGHWYRFPSKKEWTALMVA